MKDLELFKDIENFEGLYEISNLGRILSKVRKKPKFMSNKRFDKDGYVMVDLTKDGKIYKNKVHRLVAQAFIPNIDNKPMVNHINGVKNDNKASNLEWLTNSENLLHGHHVLRNGKPYYNQKIVIMLNDEKEFVKEFESLSAASRYFNITPQSIHASISGRRKKVKGYYWQYKNTDALKN